MDTECEWPKCTVEREKGGGGGEREREAARDNGREGC